MVFNQSGMALSVSLIILFVLTLLVLGAMENNLLNQKMAAALQAQVIAFNGAEAGILAQQAQINGQTLSLSDLKGQITYQISSDTVDSCQQHIFGITATASYQNAQIRILSAYLQARQPPIPGCPADTSHQLWWQQVDN